MTTTITLVMDRNMGKIPEMTPGDFIAHLKRMENKLLFKLHFAQQRLITLKNYVSDNYCHQLLITN